MIALDVGYLIENAGGPGAMLTLLGKYSPTVPTYATVQMWGVRKAIPSKWVGLVIYACHKEFGMEVYEMCSDMGELSEMSAESEEA